MHLLTFISCLDSDWVSSSERLEIYAFGSSPLTYSEVFIDRDGIAGNNLRLGLSTYQLGGLFAFIPFLSQRLGSFFGACFDILHAQL